MSHRLSPLLISTVINGPIANPHAILGMHEEDKAICIRTFCPGALSVHVICEAGILPMTQIDSEGFFVWNSVEKVDFFSYELKIKLSDGTAWQTADPYSFLPQFGEIDLHLFSSGKHLELHRKMGGRTWQVDEVKGTLFTVWAPNALAVSAVGSFNNWDSRRHPMRSLGESGVWELFIPAVACGDYYRFIITTQAGKKIEKSDPYATAFEKRPGNSSKVEDPFSYRWSDSEWMTARESKNCFSSPISVY